MPEMVTPEELALINEKFAKEPLLSAYCIPMMAADTQRVIDDRALRLDVSTIAKYAKDAAEGPPLLLSHSHMTSHMGVGRIFEGKDENGKLYLKAYMPLGVDIPNWFGGKFNTDALSKAYDAGLANAVSIGFTFERAECNLCHEDVRSPECPHAPGQAVEVDGQSVECSPVIFAGSKGKLLETSLVWQGALANAKTVKRSDLPGQFGAESSDIVLEKGVVPELASCRLSMVLPKPVAKTEAVVQMDATATVNETADPITELALTHNSTLAKTEPDWGGVDKTKLPRSAFADQGNPGMKSTWKYPHHWVQNGGGENADGVYTTGTMYLHRGGLRAARAAAGGARSGQEASPAVKAHLDAHAKVIGMGQNQLAFLDLWPLDPEWLAYPEISAAMDTMTEERFALMVQEITAEQDRIGEEAVRRAVAHHEEVEALKAQIATLTPLSEFGKIYLATLTERAITAGVKLMGNDFQHGFYTKIFEAAASNGDATVVEKAAEAWEAELAARFTSGRQTVEPELQAAGVGALSLNGEMPPQTFDRLVAEELKANHWGDERYGDAVRAVGRKYPELVQALKA